MRLSYMGLDLDIPEDVFAPTPMSELLGRAVVDEVRPGDRVLDMGAGCGVNAILAARTSIDVVGVDINPLAVSSAAANASRNGVSGRTTFLQSDVFDGVEDKFDLIIFDPPFRWFAPRDLREVSIADDNYGALTRFMTEVGNHLAAGGRFLLFFGTSGDIDYLYSLIDRSPFRREVIVQGEIVRDEMIVSYYTLRLNEETKLSS